MKSGSRASPVLYTAGDEAAEHLPSLGIACGDCCSAREIRANCGGQRGGRACDRQAIAYTSGRRGSPSLSAAESKILAEAPTGQVVCCGRVEDNNSPNTDSSK